MPGPFLRDATYPTVIGCDEVGRGALCGPVMVCAVYFDAAALPPALLEALDDSKRLKAPLREALAAALRSHARVALAAGAAPAIDRADIRRATLDAMRRAVLRLGLAAPVLVDGRDIPPGLGTRASAVVGGDRRVPQIAAASIVAKVVRDRLMATLGSRHPEYGWGANAGYGTALHLAALARSGPTRHHRLSFAPVALSRREPMA